MTALPVATARCPVCGWAPGGLPPFRLEALYRVRSGFLSAQVGYQICPRDGVIFMSPRPTGEALEQIYEGAVERIVPSVHERHLRRYDFILSALDRIDLSKTERAVVDVGCQDGGLLKVFASHRWRTFGIEASLAAVDEARRNVPAAEIVHGFIPEALAHPSVRRSDLLTMSHVLEHLDDPGATLRAIHAAGVKCVFLEVPNADAGLYPRITREYGHLQYFSPSNLCELVTASGFKILSARPSPLDTSVNVIQIVAARVGDDKPSAKPLPENERDERVRAGEEMLNQAHTKWERHLDTLSSRLREALSKIPPSSPIALYGAGSDAYRILRVWPQDRSADCFIETNESLLKQGMFLGREVITPAEALKRGIQAVLVTPRNAGNQIRNTDRDGPLHLYI